MAGAAKFAGRVAIVTAGGQGIGESTAMALAREGANVAIVDINLEEATRVGKAIEAAGGSALVRKTDVTRSSEVNAMVKDVLARWNTVDILVNAAGGFHRFAPINDISEDEWDRVITLNMKTAFLCTQAVANVMMEKKRGRIISISSGAGVSPNPYAPTYIPYGAAKAGLIGFSKVLAKDLGPYGITVNTVSPGTTLTPRVKKVRDAKSIENLIAMNPMRCLVEPEDAAAAILFLASDEARYITGINMFVNAGNLIL